MKRVKIAELEDHLAEHLRAVQRGSIIEVTDRDKPIAHIVLAVDETLELIPAEVPFAEVQRLKFKPAKWSRSSLEILLEERGRQASRR